MNEKALPKTSGSVLWLMPEGEEAATLGRWIDQLAERLRGPRFIPHLTLMGGLEADRTGGEDLAVLAREIAPFEISMAGVAFSEEPYRALCLAVAMNRGLWRAHRKARSLAPARRFEPFFPHLSLYYGYAPLAERFDALRDLGAPPTLRFPVRRLHLVSAAGGPEDWQVLDSFSLRPGAPATKPGRSPNHG